MFRIKDKISNSLPVKGFKKIFSFLPPALFEKFLHHSLLSSEYKEISHLTVFQTREDLWKNIIDKYNNEKINFLEFGVYEGYSIKTFSELNTNPDSSFVGFDSFVGLPTFWNYRYPKGSISAGGLIPKLDDERIAFEKGWFQNTLPKFLQKNNISDNLIVHYDADLYSSTLFSLISLDSLKKSYYAIFDEILGDETRALYNYQQISGAKVEFIGKTMCNGYPEAISCKIIPCEKYEV